MKEYDLYTGILRYKNINFTFVFDKKVLRLVPPKEKADEVLHWFMRQITKGVYTLGDDLYINEILCGITNETGHKIYFLPSYTSVSHYNSTLIISVEYYVLNKFDREFVDRISIQGPEINHIYPTTMALGECKWGENGQLLIKTKSFDETTSSKESFNFRGHKISVSFGISLSNSFEVGKAPMNLNSIIILDFQPTNDYRFIIKLVQIVRQFIQFLCYRKNIVFSRIELSAPTDKSLHERFATLYELKEKNEIETYPIKKERVIKYEYLINYIGKIFEDIVNQKLYMRHIPESYESGKHKTAASFVMISSAFEWEFKRNYPNGITKSEKAKKAGKKVNDIIAQLIGDNYGEVKKILKYLQKRIEDNSLENEINQYGTDYADITSVFGNYLYSLNNAEVKYSDIGKRIANQRNAFAHGNIDNKFEDLALLDLVYLEYIIYIMQLKYFGISDFKIKAAINKLFDCNLLIGN